jgi:ribonuclease Y
MSLAIQRYASDFVSDNTISTVSLPGDEMKGRIIGREGRNIRALEAATGVEFIVDDTPETVLLSCFDPVRREIGRISLGRLISDGRIHPTRIEDVVEKVKKEIDATIKEEGEKAIFDLGLHGIHPELVKLVGRLKYRTSYGQNVLKHSIEVAYLASVMSGELGVDSKLAKRAGILHDIGKAVDHEIEGSHQSIGADLAKKYGENVKVVNAIQVHHGEGDPITVEASLIAAADALSAARPGARKETLVDYVKRVEKLEQIATSFDGVNKSYAIQAGREVRIIVKPDEVSDEVCSQLSRDLAKKIEEELTYPGQIKVTVIRESRYVGYAK